MQHTSETLAELESLTNRIQILAIAAIVLGLGQVLLAITIIILKYGTH